MSLKIINANNLPYELLLAKRPTTKLRNAFNNNRSADKKAQISKIIQSQRFLGSLLSTLAGPLMKVAVLLEKNILPPLGLTAASSAMDAGIQKKIHGSETTILMISNEEMYDIMNIIQALKDSTILLKGVTKTIKNETQVQKGGFLNMLLGNLGASFLGNMLTGKGIVRAAYQNNKQKRLVRAGYGNTMDFQCCFIL